MLWPAPRKFDDGAGGTSLGYLKQIVLPLRIVAKLPRNALGKLPRAELLALLKGAGS